MLEKIWVTSKDKIETPKINGVPDFISRLLRKRGISGEEEVRNFLEPSLGNLNDPYLLPDMREAVDRILDACDNGEHITVFGDYDADGITATAVLYHFLTGHLEADADYYIPNRLLEGYGLSKDAIDIIAKRNTTLIVTVDCGISAFDEIEYAKEKGIDVIVTDHHQCGEMIPECVAAVNPMRKDSLFPFQKLAGVGVAFNLVCAIAMEIGADDEVYDYLPITAVGTIGDSMPLLYDNRIIVACGLDMIKDGKWTGLSKLLENAKPKNPSDITASSITFGIVPRLNAAGRMGDAEIALKLLLSEDEEESIRYCEEISAQNAERQKIERAITEQAMKPENLKTCESDCCVIALGYEWHHGVIGIVASKLMEKFGKPAIVLSCCADECSDGVMRARGSARSVEGFNLYAAIEQNARYLERFGGHEMAAGLTIDISKIDDFIKGMNEYAEKNSIVIPKFRTIEIDGFISPEEITVEGAESISLLEPFGVGNTCPVFCTSGFTGVFPSKVGDEKQYLKLRFVYNDGDIHYLAEGMSFTDVNYYNVVSSMGTCSCVYNLETNEYQGRKSPFLRIIDVIDSDYLRHEDVPYNDLFNTTASYTLTRDEMAAYYKVLKSFGEAFTFNDLFKARKYLENAGFDFNWFKLRYGLEVFCDVGLVEKNGAGKYNNVVPDEKRNLSESEIYRELVR